MTAPIRPPEQPDLFARRDSRIRRAFEKFHFENPHVYAMLRDLAIGYLSSGQRHGVAFFYEAMRHDRFKTTGEWFKLNNNFRSHYARMLMEREPRLAGYFETRELTG